MFIYSNWLATKVHANEFDLICLDLGFSIQTKKDKIDIILDFLEIELHIIAIKARCD